MKFGFGFIFLLTALFACSTLAAPKNTFRPWRGSMGPISDHPMPVPESGQFEIIRGTIARPKGVQGLKGGMPPPAGPEPEATMSEKAKADEKLRQDKNVMSEKKAGRIGMWTPFKDAE